LKNVELARVLEKRAERKRQAGKEVAKWPREVGTKRPLESEGGESEHQTKKKAKEKPARAEGDHDHLESVLGSIF